MVLLTKRKGRSGWGKETPEFYFEDSNLKMVFGHPSGDAEDGMRHASLEPREQERAEDVNLEPPRHR